MSRNDKKKNITGIVVGIIIALLVVAAVIGLFVLKNRDAKADEHVAPVEEDMSLYGDESLFIDADVDKALSDYRMIEIIGIDNGGRSDVIFVVAINDKTKEAKMFTVYRDTLMKVATKGQSYTWGGHEYTYYKCNRGYQKEGKYGTMKMLNSHLDLNIRELLGINWDGVSHLVDELGGITVNITDSVKQLMNGSLAKSDNAVSSGEQTLNGKQAVAYLRCRKDEGSDAGTRSRRNEEVLIQIFDKVKTLGTEEKIELYDQLANYFESNMSRTTITELLAELSELSIKTYDGYPYKYDIMWDQWNGFYYWVPQDDLKSNTIRLHNDIFGQADYVPSQYVEQLNEELETYKETLH